MSRVREKKMKTQSKLSILITLSLVTLIATIGLANAQPIPIGATTWLPNPWESNPGNYIDNTLFGISSPTAMYDGRLTTEGYFQLADWDADTDIILTTFDAPASTFTIGWVDLKINYQVDPLWDDTWEIQYTVGAKPWITLYSYTGLNGQFDPDSASGQTCVWSQVSEPNDGVWDWTDINQLQVRFLTTPGPDGWSDYMLLHVREVWATVYAPPLPLAGGGGGGGAVGMSIQPPSIPALPAGRRFFIDIYLQGITGLAGYEVVVNFDTTWLTPLAGGWSYYPFTDKAVDVIDDAGGYVSMSYTIPVADPNYGPGWSGNFPIARIYFVPATGIPADWYSWLTFSVSLLGDSAANRIIHMEYDGLYGTAPPGAMLLSWVNTSPFPYSNPVTTEWIEVYPDAGVRHHFSSWYGNEPGVDILDPSDQFDMTPIDPPGPVRDYHLDKIWEVNADPNINIHIIATIKDEPEFPLGIGILMAIAPMIAIVYIWRLRKRRR